MAKGLFTQCMCVLTNGETTPDDIESACRAGGFEIVKRSDANQHWQFGGPSLIVSYSPEQNGYIVVDLVNHPWPDEMGHPKSDPMSFGAWSMGHFGPLAFPGGLTRAQDHSWAWEAGRTIAPAHRGFIRIRLSYVFGAKPEAKVMPPNYNPVAELTFLNSLLLAVLGAPGALCYFNPNGEVLRDGDSFQQSWDECASEEKIPLHLWINVRFARLSPVLLFMDTVGNGQIDIKDVEAVFPENEYDPGEVGYYLRNVSLYLLENENRIKDGDPIDGPNETNLSWTIEFDEEGTMTPPRRVLRLYPKSRQEEVRAALAAIKQGTG